jgi:hypothetical protein
MEKLGWVDGWGGTEFERVFPETLAFIRDQAMLGPYATPDHEVS